MAEVKLRIKQIDEGSRGVQGFGQNLSRVVGMAGNAAAAVAAAGAVFKQAFDLSREGADLNQLEESFRRMNDEIYDTPGLLDAMSEAARGTVKETDLMASLLTLTAGASRDAAKMYAEAAPELMEIAKAASALNPTLGDSQFMFDSLALGIKRGSPMILDNLGITIKLGEAHQMYADSLGKSVDLLTAEEKQMAILNAVLESGNVLIDQAGDGINAQGDAWDRLTVKIEEAIDAKKRWLATGLEPVLDAATNEYGNAVEERIRKNLEEADSVEALVTEVDKMYDTLAATPLGGLTVTGTLDEFQGGLADYARALASASTSQEDFRSNMRTAFGANIFDGVDAGQQYITLATGVTVFTDELNELIPTHSEQLALLSQMGTAEYAAGAERYRELTDATNDFGESLSDLNAISAEYNAAADTRALDSYQASLEQLAQIGRAQLIPTTERMREEMGELVDNFYAVEGPVTAYLTAQENLATAQDALATATGEAYDEADTAVREATDSMIAAHDDLIASYQQLAVETALATAVQEGDDAALQTALDYAVAIGAMTQAEADARLEAALLREDIEDLSEQVVTGGEDAEIAAQAFQLLQDGMAESADEALRLAEFLNNIPQNVHVSYTTDTTGWPPPPDTTQWAGGNDNPTPGGFGSNSGSAGGDGARAMGGPVRGGGSYWVGELGPEIFVPDRSGQIVPNHQIAGATNNYTFNIIQRPGESADMLARRVVALTNEKMGRLS